MCLPGHGGKQGIFLPSFVFKFPSTYNCEKEVFAQEEDADKSISFLSHPPTQSLYSSFRHLFLPSHPSPAQNPTHPPTPKGGVEREGCETEVPFPVSPPKKQLKTGGEGKWMVVLTLLGVATVIGGRGGGGKRFLFDSENSPKKKTLLENEAGRERYFWRRRRKYLKNSPKVLKRTLCLFSFFNNVSFYTFCFLKVRTYRESDRCSSQSSPQLAQFWKES